MKHRYLIDSLSGFYPWHLALLTVFITGSTFSSAYAVTFTPSSKNGAPTQTTGGASRGSFFTNKGNGAPTQTTGGASRSIFFTNKGKGAPTQTTGGASRSNLFTNRGNGAPSQTTGGSSRVGNSYLHPSVVTSTNPVALIGLMPPNYYGTTVSERPTVMVYLPASSAEDAVFSIKDETGKMHYQMTIPVTGKSGVIGIKLPADAPLTVGKNYQWFLALKVDGELSPSTPYIDGWIQRIQPSTELVTAMQQQNLLKQAQALGKDGVWYDCVATLAALHVNQPDNPTILKHWEELLASVSLKEIVAAPLMSNK